MKCTLPPKGWRCTRASGHEGPCAAVRVGFWRRVGDAFGDALGEYLFGGNR